MEHKEILTTRVMEINLFHHKGKTYTTQDLCIDYNVRDAGNAELPPIASVCPIAHITEDDRIRANRLVLAWNATRNLSDDQLQRMADMIAQHDEV
jgi:hypothetical protein